jgi:hypothetical protein
MMRTLLDEKKGKAGLDLTRLCLAPIIFYVEEDE